MVRVLVLGSLRRAFKFVHGADTIGTGESHCGTYRCTMALARSHREFRATPLASIHR
jgi:hypothetical protein